MSTKVKIQAKDVSSAIAQGLKDLGLRRDQVEVTVLERPKKGFLGFGSKPAVVEIRQKRWSSSELDAQIYMDVPRKKRGGRGRNASRRRQDRDAYSSAERRRGRRYEQSAYTQSREKAPKANEPQLLPCERIQNAVIPENLKAPMQEAKQYLQDMLTAMDIKTENLNVWWDEQQQRILLTFDCDHPAIVIGKEGKTLESIQYLCTLALSRHFDKPISVITDTQNYWRKAEDKINAEIERGVSFIEAGNSIYRFRPMSAQLRRYIHRALEGHATVATSSEGEGKWRKVTLRPKTKEEQSQTPSKPVEEALAQAAQENEINAYAETSSCCGGETECQHCTCQAETPAQETPAPQQTEAEVQIQETVVVATVEQPAAQEQPAAESAAQTYADAAPAQAQPSQEEAAPAAAVQPAPEAAEEKKETVCSCGPLFDAVAETEKQDVK